ncbi:hypothetical protein SGRIM128S_04247 [Streptomyces griseomycini]
MEGRGGLLRPRQLRTELRHPPPCRLLETAHPLQQPLPLLPVGDWHSVAPETLKRMPAGEITVAVVVATRNLAVGDVVGSVTAMVVFAERVARLAEVTAVAGPDGTTVVYRVTGELFLASSNGLVGRFDHAADPGKVVIGLSAARIWDASSVAALDATGTTYAQRGRTVEITGLNDPSVRLHDKLSGELVGGHRRVAASAEADDQQAEPRRVRRGRRGGGGRGGRGRRVAPVRTAGPVGSAGRRGRSLRPDRRTGTPGTGSVRADGRLRGGGRRSGPGTRRHRRARGRRAVRAGAGRRGGRRRGTVRTPLPGTGRGRPRLRGTPRGGRTGTGRGRGPGRPGVARVRGSPRPAHARDVGCLAVARARGRDITFDALTRDRVDSRTRRDIPAMLVPVVALTADNIEDTVVRDGVHTVEDICTAAYAAACAEIGLTP